MLNYIWLGLLSIGIASALIYDLSDFHNNKYMNGKDLPAYFITNQNNDGTGELIIPKENYEKFYRIKIKDEIKNRITYKQTDRKNSYNIRITVNEGDPELWKDIAAADGDENDITGKLTFKNKQAADTAEVSVRLEEVSFLKMKNVTNAAIDYASTAVNISLGLIGIMALWLGLMKIAYEAGLIRKISLLIKPLTKFLFPEVPPEHPAIGSIIMNISANMLGLGNAATPFGLKAMEELDTLNKNKGTATNAMCMFLAINTAGLTLIPATAIAVRAAAGSSEPAIIIGTSFFGALCATIAGITTAKIFEYLSKGKVEAGSFIKPLSLFLLLIGIVFILIINGLSAEMIKDIIKIISTIAIPIIILVFIGYGIIKKVKIYEVFVEGAKEGFNIAIKIIPYLVAMLVAIGIFRAGGALDLFVKLLSPLTDLIGFPAEALPMALMRPLSGSGSLGIMSEIITVHGPDSFIGILVSTIMGSTETTFYVLALYFGSVNIKRARHAVLAGVIADIAGILGALFIVKLLFG
ncbi:nucleoside recognition domain-containing protein [Melioribacter sp. OK-6-Me]|uniref:nucleoside recognition domain-containing protein n=1 Tax=unclassified Melioribacter TaxID=2627329 RepID=UPI003ED9F8DE